MQTTKIQLELFYVIKLTNFMSKVNQYLYLKFRRINRISANKICNTVFWASYNF